jgi:hypothetical protein
MVDAMNSDLMMEEMTRVKKNLKKLDARKRTWQRGTKEGMSEAKKDA